MMFRKFLLVLLVTYVSTTDNPLKVSVYYEILCPDSIKFVVDQFYPTFKEMSGEFDVNLVAYGFGTSSNSSGKWEFTCQHGEKECYGNKIQSCVVFQNSVENSVEYLNCVMENGKNWDDTILEECANKSGIQWSEVQNCLTSGRADLLLAENGEKTAAVTPKITFIPTITFNDFYNTTILDNTVDNFKKVLCEFLEYGPQSCVNTDDDPFVYVI